MKSFKGEIESLFKTSSFVANEVSLVQYNGYDTLEKEYAVKFFSGKSWEDVLQHLRKGKHHNLEEWTVLKKNALIHYGYAYFSYLLETMEDEHPDEGFVSYLIHELYQLVYMNKGSPFSEEQTNLIEKMVTHIQEKVQAGKGFEYWNDTIKNNVDEFFTELKKYK